MGFQTGQKAPTTSCSKEEKSKRKKKKKMDQPQTKSMVTIPYVRGVSDALRRTFRRHGIATAMKPHKTLKQVLVHPKDKRTAQDSARVVYSIICKDCLMVYIGESGRRYGVREKEHMKDDEKNPGTG